MRWSVHSTLNALRALHLALGTRTLSLRPLPRLTSTTVSLSALGLLMPNAVLKLSIVTAMLLSTSASMVSS